MKRLIRPVLQLTVTVGALFLAFRLAGAWHQDLGIKTLNYGWLLTALALHVCTLCLGTYRFHLILGWYASPIRIGFFQLLRIQWAGFGLSQFALGSLSGDALRLVSLRDAGMPWGFTIGKLLLDRIIGLLGLGLVMFAAIYFVAGPYLTGLFAAIFTATIFLTLAAIPFFRRLSASLAILGALQKLLDDLMGLFTQRTGWACLTVTILAHCFNILIFFSLGKAFGLLPPMPETFIALPIGMLASVLPISLGGWGVRELSITAAFQILGTPFPDAVITAILFGISNVAFGLPGLLWFGISWFIFDRKNNVDDSDEG